jgi:glycosyltransferase involved in cell wall biosynthesis
MTDGFEGFSRASIVVPTFNRLADLRRVVAAVSEQIQRFPGTCELVVVNDGSSDGTGEWLDVHAPEFGFKAVHQDNAGPARARNRGVSESDGEIILFLGDDTVPADGWLLEHLEGHRIAGGTGAVAILGYTSFPAQWDSPFLRWINEQGAQFGYALIENPSRVPFNFFYTSNISLPRAVFEGLGGFREDFPAAAWEDIEFAYRAVDGGLTLRYQPRARTIHHHRIGIRSFCRRQQTSGRSAAIFAGLHPELEAFLGVGCIGRSSLRAWLSRPLLRSWIRLGEMMPGLVSDAEYRRLLDGYYLEALRASLRKSASI